MLNSGKIVRLGTFLAVGLLIASCGSGGGGGGGGGSSCVINTGAGLGFTAASNNLFTAVTTGTAPGNINARGCENGGCHGGGGQSYRNKLQNAAAITAAIQGYKGGMGVYCGQIADGEISDIATKCTDNNSATANCAGF